MAIRDNAMKFVERTLKMDEIIRPDQCQICARKPGYHPQKSIVAHHWNGYDHPLDVWWICRSCNRFLAGKHDGSLTLEQAKQYVKRCQLERLGLL